MRSQLPIEIINQICQYNCDLDNDTFILKFHENGNPYFTLNKNSNTCKIIHKKIKDKLHNPLIKEFIRLEQLELFSHEQIDNQYHKYIVFVYTVCRKLVPIDYNL